MITEEWRDIEGYKGAYSVSNLGSVWSTHKGGHYLTPCIPSTGYPLVTLCGGPAGQHTPHVHTLILEAFVGKAPQGYECSHIDGVRANSRLSNLEWVSRTQNAEMRVGHGTSPTGEQNPRAVLSEDSVREIRTKLASGIAGVALAEEYGVAPNAISRIKNGHSWQSLI